ncbi:MAG TPA: hypothetical protein VMB47_16470 [Candidatus Aquilonibacter sp.]|nr:hypothetical protein [Candidatus Aquilonibacter sp.]
MTWADFYLVCFAVGLSLTVLSFAFGALHLHVPVKWHMARAGAHAAGARGGVHAAKGAAGKAMSWFTPPAIFAFLAWFGGTGFLLTQYYRGWFLLVLTIALCAGCIGEGIVWWFLVKLLMPHETVLQDSDYELVGTIAKVNSTIREGGTGEIVFSQGGVRCCAGARREDGKALEKGREVVIARVDKGIAYVAPWEDWAKLQTIDKES